MPALPTQKQGTNIASSDDDCPILRSCKTCLGRQREQQEPDEHTPTGFKQELEPLLEWKPVDPSSPDAIVSQRHPMLLSMRQQSTKFGRSEAAQPSARGVRFQGRGVRSPPSLWDCIDRREAQQGARLGEAAVRHDLLTPISVDSVVSPGMCSTRSSALSTATAEWRCQHEKLLTPLSLDTVQSPEVPGAASSCGPTWVHLCTPDSVRTEEASKASSPLEPSSTVSVDRTPTLRRCMLQRRQPVVARLFE